MSDKVTVPLSRSMVKVLRTPTSSSVSLLKKRYFCFPAFFFLFILFLLFCVVKVSYTLHDKPYLFDCYPVIIHQKFDFLDSLSLNIFSFLPDHHQLKSSIQTIHL